MPLKRATFQTPRHADTETRPRGPARRRWRSAVLLVTAVAIMAALQLSLTGTASADSCWQDSDGNVHCMYDGGTIRPGEDGDFFFGGGGGGGGRHQPIIGDPDPIEPTGQVPKQPVTGVDRASAALNKDACANLIGEKTGKTANDVRAIYNGATKTFNGDYHPQGHDIYADAPFGAGAQGTITMYTPYTLVTSDSIKGLLPEGTQLTQPLNREEVQAVIQLHEAAHLTGALDHGTNLPGIDPVFNMRIVDACFGVIKRPL
jgi:hypothetical protein